MTPKLRLLIVNSCNHTKKCGYPLSARLLVETYHSPACFCVILDSQSTYHRVTLFHYVVSVLSAPHITMCINAKNEQFALQRYVDNSKLQNL